MELLGVDWKKTVLKTIRLTTVLDYKIPQLRVTMSVYVCVSVRHYAHFINIKRIVVEFMLNLMHWKQLPEINLELKLNSLLIFQHFELEI